MFQSEDGFSVLAALVFSVVSVLIVAGVSRTMSQRSTKVAGVSQKFQSFELQQALVRVFSDPVNCSCNLNPFKSGRQLAFSRDDVLKAEILGKEGPSLEFTKVFSSCNQLGRPEAHEVLVEAKKFAFNNASYGLFVSQIQLKNIRSRQPANEYVAELTINFSKDSQGPQALRLEALTPAPQAKIQFTADEFGNIIDCKGANWVPVFNDDPTRLFERSEGS